MEEAMSACSQINQDSALVTIHSNEEQQFLNNFLVGFNDVSPFSWLGLNKGRYNVSFDYWMDWTRIDYTNWADEALKDGSKNCGQMSLDRANLGKWLDESCKSTALIVCQRKPVFDFNTLWTAFENIEKEMKLSNVSIFPLGFVYTHLPEQSSPQTLWPHMSWTDVTEQYAGLFFRVEGNVSLPFGKVQDVKSPTYFETVDEKLIRPADQIFGKTSTQSWRTTRNWDRNVRPRNTAVKIWKRVG